MFNAFLNYSASTYEAIIAAFIVLGLIQTAVLVSKARLVNDLEDIILDNDIEIGNNEIEIGNLKQNNVTLAKAATKALFSIMADTFKTLAKMADKLKLAEARADAAEDEVRAMIAAAADKDDAADNLRTAATPEPFFDDSHFVQRPHPQSLDSLFAMLDGKGRNGAALDDLIFGQGNHGRGARVVHGGDLVHGRVHGADITPDDVLSLLRGDATALERKVGAKCVGVQVVGENGRVIEGPEAEALIASFLDRADRAPRPSFDADETALKAGTRLHEEIERSLGGQPDESCSTQQPHGYAASSPRAG